MWLPEVGLMQGEGGCRCMGGKSGPLWLVGSEGGRGSLYAWYARSEILRYAQNDKGEWVCALLA